MAFHGKKKTLEQASKRPQASITSKVAMSRISRLEAENRRLEGQNEALMMQFIRWQYNCYMRGMSEADLNKAIPDLDMKSTENSGVAKEA